AVLRWKGVGLGGKLFDTMVAHSLIEPDLRHALDYMAESYLGYTPTSISKIAGDPKSDQPELSAVPLEQVAEYATERADVTFQLAAALEPLLKEKGQERVFYEIESALLPVLVDMEFEGIRLDSAAMNEFATQLAKEIDQQEK